MTTNPPKRKLRLIFAPLGAGDIIPIHHSMKIIQASFREWDHPNPRHPHTREQSIRRRSSRILNTADKSYLEMIGEIPFQYDPFVELRFQSELSKISYHCDSLTITEEAEAVNILMGKINIPTVFNWIPVFNEMATGCDVPILVTTVDDIRFVLMACLDELKPARYPIDGV